MFARPALPFKRPCGASLDECENADRGADPPGRGFPVSQGRRPLHRRPEARRHAACGGAAQHRGAWPHPADRGGGGPCHAGRACGHDGSGYRRGAAHSAAAGEFAGVQELSAAGHRHGQGALCRRADRRGGGGDARAGRGRAGADRGRDRAAAGAAGPACRRQRGGFVRWRGQPRGALRGEIRRCRCGVRQGGIHPEGKVRLPSVDRPAAGDARPDRRSGTPGG